MRALPIAIALLLCAGCGGSPTAETDGQGKTSGNRYAEVAAAVNGLDGQARRDKLIELAEKEKEPTWYTSLNQDVAEKLLDAYAEDTGLSVKLYRSGSENVRRRVIEETKAGAVGADVIETNGPEMVAMADAKAFAPLTAPATANLVDDSKRDGWTVSRFNIFAVAWNTDLVKPGQQPTTYADLADPKWDGKMAMEIEDYDWYWALRNHLTTDGKMTPAQAQDYFTKVASGAAFTNGHTTMRQLLVAGEYSMITSDYSYGISEVAAEGAPVAWKNPKPVQPLFARPNGVALMRNAANPAGAQLFAEWLLSEGQQVFVDSNIDPSRKDLLNTGSADVRVMDIEKYLSEEKQAIKEYEALARKGKKVGD
ncbi:MAG: extracellular solute-binding protein [Streptosporangiales bacterium]|nr:extracellular solute-binding protein [Streptosporangiales bacterium]